MLKIDALLDPSTHAYLDAACPACSAEHAYRRDSGGEQVRVPALEVVAERGCRCQACRSIWPPERYLLLGRVLGFDTPQGVVG